MAALEVRDRKNIVVDAAIEYVHAVDAIPDNIFQLSQEERDIIIGRHIRATYALKVAVGVYTGELDNEEESDYDGEANAT